MIAACAGRLYLLGGEGGEGGEVGEVWRYPPAVGGFDSERQGLLGLIDLREPRGLYVDGDGRRKGYSPSIYTSFT